MSYTYARLPLSPEAYDEIATKLKEAGYHHAFENNGDIDMHGIGVCVEEPDRHAALLGSDWQPSMVTINETSDRPVGRRREVRFRASRCDAQAVEQVPVPGS
jgi:hypothetical protein